MFAEKLFRYSIDRINGRFITGWCFSRLTKTRPVVLTIRVDDQILGTSSCSLYRRDLKETGLHPTGCCGFDFSLPASFDPGRDGVLHVYADSGRKPLASFSCRSLPMLRPTVDRPVIFMHIPKTAGTSFNAFARLCYTSQDYAPHLERLAPERRSQIAGSARYLSGHLPWREICAIANPENFDFYSIIREPFAHLHSHFNYVRLVHLEAEHEIHYDYRHNDAIRDLARRIAALDFRSSREIERFVDELSGHECDFFDNIQIRYFLDYRPERVGETDFLAAVKNLLNFRAIGLTEHYDRFRDRFCRNMGLPLQRQALRSNQSAQYQLFERTDTKIRQLVMPLVEFDCRLYEYIAQQDSQDLEEITALG